MIARLYRPLLRQSYFLLGPRGTGKTSWLKSESAGVRSVSQSNSEPLNYIDLLEAEAFNQLLVRPDRLAEFIQDPKQPVVIDEIQKIPALLDEVHRLIEKSSRTKNPLIFVLTGSSARKLKRSGANLLAGRAISDELFPLTACELKTQFSLKKALVYGMLPSVWGGEHPREYLQSYVKNYLKEEVQQEGLVRNLPAFSRCLEALSFSQASSLNISNVAADCSVPRKTVEGFIQILEDTLIARRLTCFSRRATRELTTHPKFFYFDVGVFRTLRPRGPLDSDSQITGFALETLVFQEVLALNSYLRLQYSLHFWRTAKGEEVDFVLYGEKGLIAIEVKSSDRLRETDFVGLELFGSDYPVARRYLLYAGEKSYLRNGIQVMPLKKFFETCSSILDSDHS